MTQGNAPRVFVRIPTTAFPPAASAPTFQVGRPLAGLRVGFRTDPSWTSWLRIAENWAARLRAAGAAASLFSIGEHTGEEGDSARRALREWGNSIDCAVVGIGT